MESRENPAFGRKVFFLNPIFSMRSIVISRLIENEFEIYIIDDYHDAKNILRKFPDSICFINIDDQLTHEQWFNFVKSVETDPSLKSIFLGILSSRISKANRDQFMLKASIPAGFIMMNERLEDITETIEGILNINGAKGRRQYVRTNCASDSDALMLVKMGNKMYKMHLLDISVVGTACILSPQYKDLFQANSVIRNVTVSLGEKNFTCSVAVYAVIVTPQFCKLVLLFMQGMPFSSKKLIRSYITATLQNTVSTIIKESQRDTADYSKPVTIPGIQEDSEAFLMDVGDDEPADNTVSDTSVSPLPDFDGKPEDLSVTPLF